jgi:hypothetical protein
MQVGVASAASPYGPWERMRRPIITPSNFGWDNTNANNPSAFIHDNGTVVITYKSQHEDSAGRRLTGMQQGIAIARSVQGPYVKKNIATPIPMPDCHGGCEDPLLWFSKYTQTYHILFHMHCDYKLIWSKDALTWHNGSSFVGWCQNINFSDGSTGFVSRREEPKFIRNGTNYGQITHLTNAVVTNEAGTQRSWTMITTLLP